MAKTLVRICLYIENAIIKIYQSIEWDEENSDEDIARNFSDLKNVDAFVRFLGEHLRYVDGALTQKLPWSIIKPFEKLAGAIIPGISFMFRPQWKYNYSVIINDLRKLYEDNLTLIAELSGLSLNDELTDFKEPFYIISFPSIERKNILLHCLIGHELGHFIVRDHIDAKSIKERIAPEVYKIVNEKYKEVGISLDTLFTRHSFKMDVDAAIQTVIQIWKRGLDEILSDIIGTLIFGPAMLFSMYELAMQKELDHKPDHIMNSFYPPWRYRLREIIITLQRSGSEFFPLPAEKFSSNHINEVINRRFESIKKLTEDRYDEEIINKDELIKVAYKEIKTSLKDIIGETDWFKKELRKEILTPAKLYHDIDHLTNRIKNGLPPNAVEYLIENRRPALIAEIINAAWFYKITCDHKLLNNDGLIDNDIFLKKDTLNRLTLRAIEYSDIETEYKKDAARYRRKKK